MDRRVFRIGKGACKNAFICICISVSMFVLSRNSKTLFGAPWEEGVNEKLSILVFKDSGEGTKFEQKMNFVCCMKVVENGTESLGAYENTF